MAMLPTPDFGQSKSTGMNFNPYSLMTGLGAIGGGLTGFFNNPATAAMGYSAEVPGTVSPYYNPYIQAGQRSLGTLENQFNQLISNPYTTYQMLGSNFEQSPGYQYQYNQAMNAANQAAAAGGSLGGSAHQTAASTQAQNLASQDWWNYMNRMMNLYSTGLSGLGGINQMGYGASDALAGLLAQNLMNQAGLAALEAQYENQSIGGLVGGVTSALGF